MKSLLSSFAKRPFETETGYTQRVAVLSTIGSVLVVGIVVVVRWLMQAY